MLYEYTLVAEPMNREVVAVAETQSEAHKLAWEQLSDDEREICSGLDWVDEWELAPC